MTEPTTQDLIDECASRAAWYRDCEKNAEPKEALAQTVRKEAEFYLSLAVRLTVLKTMETKNP